MSSRTLSPLRRSALAVVVAATALALAGCVDTSPVLEPTPTTSATPDATPVPTVTPEPGAMPLGVSCDELVHPDAVYAFNPNLALVGAFAPTAGSPAETAVGAGGIACRWVLESGGAGMDISLARLPQERLDELKNDAFASSQMVPTYGDEAYFAVDGGIGVAIIFQADLWMVVASEMFAEPGEPTEIIESALAAASAAR